MAERRTIQYQQRARTAEESEPSTLSDGWLSPLSAPALATVQSPARLRSASSSSGPLFEVAPEPPSGPAPEAVVSYALSRTRASARMTTVD